MSPIDFGQFTVIYFEQPVPPETSHERIVPNAEELARYFATGLITQQERERFERLARQSRYD